MEIKAALQHLVDGESLSRDAMRDVMTAVMSGEATPAQIGALLVALRMKGETIDEIAGAAEVMRNLATRVRVDQEHLIDLVGTGGDGANLFNVSTASTFVVAAAGGRVAKHGNRSVSSSSGSSDVLEVLGAPKYNIIKCRFSRIPKAMNGFERGTYNFFWVTYSQS